MKKDRVWYHIPTNKLGYAIVETIFGRPVFIFANHKEDEIPSSRFCNFVEDPNDSNSFKRSEFLDLGVF